MTGVPSALQASFGPAGKDIDVRYGLVGFGELVDGSGHTTYAHSQIVNTDVSPGDPAALFGTTAQLTTAVGHLSTSGGYEDGWDAIEHAIAEYEFRIDAVPVFVLLQAQEGRVRVNSTLTHDGILAALESKNVILNALVVDDSAALFDLVPYAITAGDFNNRVILGVEADTADALKDGQHGYYLVDQTTGSLITNKPQTHSDALQVSFNGSNTSQSGMIDTGRSILVGQNITGGIGGTAAGNYRAKTVAYQFIDITSVATVHVPGTAVPNNYRFNLYGTTQNQNVFVNEDGAITFGSANASGDNVDLSHATSGPARPNTAMIAALWDDLSAAAPNAKILRKLVDVDIDGQDDLVVQWDNYTYAGDVGPKFDAITFQVVLYANGLIQFNYRDLDSYRGFDADQTATVTGGISATVGICAGRRSQ